MVLIYKSVKTIYEFDKPGVNHDDLIKLTDKDNESLPEELMETDMKLTNHLCLLSVLRMYGALLSFPLRSTDEDFGNWYLLYPVISFLSGKGYIWPELE